MGLDYLELSPTADFHSHLRDGDLMQLILPTITQGGCDTVYVMPNLQPPITTVAAALSYRERLLSVAHDPLFTLVYHTFCYIAEAAAAGIIGVKAFPKGLTTNSEAGVLDYQEYYPVFEAMQAHDLVLNLHGEVPSTPSTAFVAADNADTVTVLNAEAMFLPTLHKLHTAFPRLRIVLEHCSTREALDAVRACGPTVAATITAHHLWMTVDDFWCGDAFNFWSDSAPHTVEAKKGRLAAGCFTQKYATQLVVAAVEEGFRQGWILEEITAEVLKELLRCRGRRFYKIEGLTQDRREQKILLEKKGEGIPGSIKSENGIMEVVPFRSGEEIWSLKWK